MKIFFKTLLMVLLMVNFLNAGFLDIESKQALKEKKLILLTIKSDTCPYCLKMKEDVFDAPKYKAQINQKYLHVEIDGKDITLPHYLHAKYLPTNFILSPKTLAILDEFPGYIEPIHFLELLNEVYAQEIK
ncbi:MAG: thioredoxin family protein [Campylobacteraceae bacterium]|nr:thioredoxin family protein [Campylobacteraceae bacterium]